MNSQKKKGNGESIIIPQDIRFNDSAPNHNNNEYNICFFGCFGHGNSEHGKKISEYLNNKAPDFFILTGDNFYDNGVNDNTQSSLFAKCFKVPYQINAPVFKNSFFFPILGNHDYGESFLGKIRTALDFRSKKAEPLNQVKLSMSELNWYMPGRYYSITDNKLFEFFCIDTNTIRFCESEQLWLQEKVLASKAKWKILVSHHPALSQGHHSNEPDVTGLNKFLIETNIHKNIHLIISAHEHNNQILHYTNNAFQIIVGNCSSKHPHKIKNKNGLIYGSDTDKDQSCGKLVITNDNIECIIYNQSTQKTNNKSHYIFNYNNELIKAKCNNLKSYSSLIPALYSKKLEDSINLDPLNFAQQKLKSSFPPNPTEQKNLSEIATKLFDNISKVKRSWQDESSIKFARRYQDLKTIDAKLKDAYHITKALQEAITKENLNWQYAKFIGEEIYYLFSDINFYCLKIITDHGSTLSKRNDALTALKNEVEKIISNVYNIFVGYYIYKKEKENVYWKAIEDLNLFEVLSNKLRAEKGFKFLTQIKFNVGHSGRKKI